MGKEKFSFRLTYVFGVPKRDQEGEINLGAGDRNDIYSHARGWNH